MNRKWANGLSGLMILALGMGASALAQGNAKPRPSAVGPAVSAAKQAADQPQADKSDSAIAIEQAAKADKYMFVFFYRDEDQATETARKSFEAAVEKFTDRAASMTVDVTKPSERVIVTRYGLARSPMPLVLVLAPNGAVTRSFTGEVADSQLETAFVSPGMQKCLKALQDRKMAFVCVQNGTTQHNAEAMQGVNDFIADAKYARTTEIITVDPADAGEKSFLEQLKVEPTTEEAVTVLMAPPGTLVGTYQGETTKDALVAAAKTAAKGCKPGGSCCPAPKKPATPPAQPQQPGSAEKP